ncbi:thiamine phosphate synthase [Staphylococcus sp. IVB6246]|uniref:thiamine phosphate synthase n=1 Tax=unclassified Staphylococcus TaxID=91994 RepID=UPI0021D2D14F|nr:MULTISPECIES: thiamine phosphate synthase [unclassified Staphylococcus]UXR69922.1 thiamine phosphate synthase [Staphylococcus sp. IVB6246]UXR71961.1 thiamine phosphate synthase [Staphylococcus sp. IVB6240]UXR74269.1 thiamine phosphate synthase [Staphylococcus sp. IVB6238]
MIIAVTPYDVLTAKHIERLAMIEPQIDGVLLRTPMSKKALAEWIALLRLREFPKSKIIIHSDIKLAKDMGIRQLHFKEGDPIAYQLKAESPEYRISMSVHSISAIIEAKAHHLDFGIYGHVFPSASKQGKTPRTNEEIELAISGSWPLVAIGGVDIKTVEEIHSDFVGIACIRSAFDTSVPVFEEMVQKWHQKKEGMT